MIYAVSIGGSIVLVAVICFLIYIFYLKDKCFGKKENLIDENVFKNGTENNELKDNENFQNNEENDKLGLYRVKI